MSRNPKKTAGLTFEDFHRLVKEGHIEPLYLFLGEERHLRERALRLLIDTVDEGDRVYNVFSYSVGADRSSASKVTIARVVDTANEQAKMFARRIVAVQSFENMKEGESELLIEYLKRPMPSTTLVFHATSLDKRRKISTALLKSCTVVSFDRPSEHRIAQWARGYSNLHGCQLESDALGHLIGLVGNDMMRLKNELDKLVAFAGDGAINRAAVQELVPRAREHTNWELWDAMNARDRKRALKLMERLLDDSDALPILGSLASLYRKLLTGRELVDRGASQEEIKKATSQWAPAFFAALRRTSRAEIVHGLRRIAEVDNAIKNSEGTPRLQMQYLVAELTLPPGAKA